MAALAVSYLRDDTSTLNADMEEHLKRQIDIQIENDGRMPAELKRGSYSMHYTFFGLSPMTVAIEIVRNTTGEELYTWEPPSGGTVEDALDFLFQHGYVEPSSWPVDGASNRFPEMRTQVLYQAMGAIYSKEPWLEWLTPPTWSAGTGLSWICPTLMQPFPLSWEPPTAIQRKHSNHKTDRYQLIYPGMN